jgi:transcriptional regulator with XRE-family HTH domain
MDLGTVIKNIRKKKGFTQTQLAELCGITQTYLSQIENNQKEPNTATLKIIAEKLDFPLPILFFLSIEDTDIPEKKRDAYNMISPSVKSLIDTFFSNDQDN